MSKSATRKGWQNHDVFFRRKDPTAWFDADEVINHEIFPAPGPELIFHPVDRDGSRTLRLDPCFA